MKGLEKFTEARKRGVLLSKTVLLWHGINPLRVKKYREDLTEITEGVAESDRQDFRILVGLDVIFCPAEWNAEAFAIQAKIKQYAASVLTAITDTGDMSVWTREKGEVAL